MYQLLKGQPVIKSKVVLQVGMNQDAMLNTVNRALYWLLAESRNATPNTANVIRSYGEQGCGMCDSLQSRSGKR